MTTAPDTLSNLQDRLELRLHTTNLGIVGDERHIETGGYHIGAQSLRAAGMVGDYSLYYPIDYRATHDYACAIDIGGSDDLLMLLGNRIVHALKNRDSRVYGKVRAVNAPFDNVMIDRRYDTEDPTTSSDDNIQSCTDRNHIHLEVYRTLVLDQGVMDGIYSVLAGEQAPESTSSISATPITSEDDEMQLVFTVTKNPTSGRERGFIIGGVHGITERDPSEVRSAAKMCGRPVVDGISEAYAAQGNPALMAALT